MSGAALVTGIAGQDGSYLAELLLAKDYLVTGAVRDVTTAARQLPTHLVRKLELVQWNMQDERGMIEVLRRYRPAEVYNLAGCSSGSRMHSDPVRASDINGLAVTRLLAAILEVDPSIRLCQASSSEMFGVATESPQSEVTSFHPRSPYGAAKLYAHHMVSIYRQRHALFACSAILFNHESPRRRLEFVTRKVTKAAAQIKLGLASKVHLGNLDARRDWGFAGDFVRGIWLMMQHSAPDDYVFATGCLHSVRELCEIAFAHVGLDYRDYVREDPALFRPAEEVPLVGDARKAQKALGWKPRVSFEQLIATMMEAELRALRPSTSLEGGEEGIELSNG